MKENDFCFVLQCCLYFYSFSFSFFSFFFLFVHKRSSLSLFLSLRAMYDCQCMYGPLSRPVPIYVIKPPKHVARTPLSANLPPSSPFLDHPRLVLLTSFHLLFFLLLFIIRVAATATSFVASIISFPFSYLLFLHPPTPCPSLSGFAVVQDFATHS